MEARSCLLGLKVKTVRGFILIDSPVFGFRAFRAFFFLKIKLANLEIRTFSPSANRFLISSSKISTVYIVSDFAEYNSSDLNSKFYQNVVINYEDKEITCDYFDVDMETNIAIAYNNVVVTDPKSIMKAGKIILNIETKVININPNNEKKKISVITK